MYRQGVAHLSTSDLVTQASDLNRRQNGIAQSPHRLTGFTADTGPVHCQWRIDIASIRERMDPFFGPSTTAGIIADGHALTPCSNFLLPHNRISIPGEIPRACENMHIVY